MQECPKFIGCSAPICPLDPDWKLRVVENGDRVCFFMRENGKPGAAQVHHSEGDILEAAGVVTQDPCLAGYVRRAVQRASLTPTKSRVPGPI
jgi:hypothetical protein